MSRINSEMTGKEVIIVMCGGNPGAVNVCLMLIEKDEWAFVDMCHLDDMGIYQSDIWICYKDICHENIEELINKIRDHSILDELNKIRG